MSLLKKADNLLKNPQSERDDLEKILADLTIVLTTNREMAKDVKTRYAEIIVKLNNKLGYESEKEKEYQKRETTRIARPTAIQASPIVKPVSNTLEQKFTPDQIRHYAQKSFLPDNLKIDNTYWLDLSDRYVRQFCNSSLDNGVTIFDGRAQLIFENEKPNLWLGDVKIKGQTKIPQGSFMWDESYGYPRRVDSIVFDAEAIINYKRVNALFQHYSKVEHRPTEKGELGWTMNTPIIARNSGRPTYVGRGLNRAAIHPSAEYIVFFNGFVVFVSGISESDVKNNRVFDIVYEGDNFRRGPSSFMMDIYGSSMMDASPKATSGSATLITNRVREIIMEEGNIQIYRKMEQEEKFK
ncbi:MAG: hypothetical protein ACP5N2_04745 [Candidatus Nanoarchaeia archaeon]